MEWASKRPRLDDYITSQASRYCHQDQTGSTSGLNDDLWGDDITAEEFDFIQSQVETQAVNHTTVINKQNRKHPPAVGLLGSTPSTSSSSSSSSESKKHNTGEFSSNDIKQQVEKYKNEIIELQEQQDAKDGKIKMLEQKLMKRSAELAQERLDRQRMLNTNLKDLKQQISEKERMIDHLKTELQFKEQEVRSTQGRLHTMEQQLAQKNNNNIPVALPLSQSQSQSIKQPNFKVQKKKKDLTGFNFHSADFRSGFEKHVPNIDQSVQTDKDHKENMVQPKPKCDTGKLLSSSLLSLITQFQEQAISQPIADNDKPSSKSKDIQHMCSCSTSKETISFETFSTAVSQVMTHYHNVSHKQHECKSLHSLCGSEVGLLPYINKCFKDYLHLLTTCAFKNNKLEEIRGNTSLPTSFEEGCIILQNAKQLAMLAISLLRELFLYSCCIKWAVARAKNTTENSQTMNEGVLILNLMEPESEQVQQDTTVQHMLNIIYHCQSMDANYAKPILEAFMEFLEVVLAENSSSVANSYSDALEKLNYCAFLHGEFGLQMAKLTISVLMALVPCPVFCNIMKKCSDRSSVLKALCKCFSLISSVDLDVKTIMLKIAYSGQLTGKLISSLGFRDQYELIMELMATSLASYSPSELHGCNCSCWLEFVQEYIRTLYKQLEITFESKKHSRITCMEKGASLLILLSSKLLGAFCSYRAKEEEIFVCLIYGLSRFCKLHNLKDTAETIQEFRYYTLDNSVEFDLDSSDEMAVDT